MRLFQINGERYYKLQSGKRRWPAELILPRFYRTHTENVRVSDASTGFMHAYKAADALAAFLFRPDLHTGAIGPLILPFFRQTMFCI